MISINIFLIILFVFCTFFSNSSNEDGTKFIPKSVELDNDPKTIEYLVNINGKIKHLILRKTLMKDDIMTININGNTKSINKNKCYFEGKINNVENSKVIIYGCNGLNGIIKENDNTYSISPHDDQSKGKKSIHKFHYIKLVQTNNSILENKKNDQIKLIYERQNLEDIPENKFGHFIMKFSVIVDYFVFIDKECCESSIEKTTDYIERLLFLLRWYYADSGVYSALMHLDIRTTKDKALNYGTSDIYKQRKYIQNYRKQLSNLSYDVTLNFVKREDSIHSTSCALKGSICTVYSVAFVTKDTFYRTLNNLAHEVGHILGLRHYDNSVDYNCKIRSGYQSIMVLNLDYGYIGDYYLTSCDFMGIGYKLNDPSSECLIKSDQVVYSLYI